MSKQTLRNLLRWGGLALAGVGFVIGRTAQTANAYQTGRVLLWIGLGMVVTAIVVRMFIRQP